MTKAFKVGDLVKSTVDGTSIGEVKETGPHGIRVRWAHHETMDSNWRLPKDFEKIGFVQAPSIGMQDRWCVIYCDGNDMYSEADAKRAAEICARQDPSKKFYVVRFPKLGVTSGGLKWEE